MRLSNGWGSRCITMLNEKLHYRLSQQSEAVQDKNVGYLTRLTEASPAFVS